MYDTLIFLLITILNLSIIKKIFDENIILACSRFFLNNLWFCLTKTRGMKSINNIKNTFIKSVSISIAFVDNISGSKIYINE